MPVTLDSIVYPKEQQGSQPTTPHGPPSASSALPQPPIGHPSYEKSELPTEVNEITIHTGKNTFHQFRHLPIELRVKIWKLASNQSRLVELDLNYINGQWSQLSSPPSLLSVCRESRFEGLKYYKLSLAKVGGRTIRMDNHVYLNLHHDILIFEEKSLNNRFKRPESETKDHEHKSYVSQISQFSLYTRDFEREAMRRIALVFSLCVVPGRCIQYINIKGIHKYPALEEIIIIREAVMFTRGYHVSVAQDQLKSQLYEVKTMHPSWKVPKVKFIDSPTYQFALEDVCGEGLIVRNWS